MPLSEDCEKHCESIRLLLNSTGGTYARRKPPLVAPFGAAETGRRAGSKHWKPSPAPASQARSTARTASPSGAGGRQRPHPGALPPWTKRRVARAGLGARGGRMARKRRPKAKPGELLAYYGAYAGEVEPDLRLAWGGGGASKADAHFLCFALSDEPAKAVKYSDKSQDYPFRSLIAELEARGYDLNTLRFSICKKSAAAATALPEADAL